MWRVTWRDRRAPEADGHVPGVAFEFNLTFRRCRAAPAPSRRAASHWWHSHMSLACARRNVPSKRSPDAGTDERLQSLSKWRDSVVEHLISGSGSCPAIGEAKASQIVAGRLSAGELAQRHEERRGASAPSHHCRRRRHHGHVIGGAESSTHHLPRRDSAATGACSPPAHWWGEPGATAAAEERASTARSSATAAFTDGRSPLRAVSQAVPAAPAARCEHARLPPKAGRPRLPRSGPGVEPDTSPEEPPRLGRRFPDRERHHLLTGGILQTPRDRSSRCRRWLP